MKSKTMITGVVIGVVALFATFEYSGAAQSGVTTSRVGVVSIRTVFDKTRQQAQYQTKAVAKRTRDRAQLEALAQEVKSAEEEMGTHKQGTTEYLKLMQNVIQKRAQLEAQQEYLKQQTMLENKLWMEKLYEQTLKIVTALAQEKGLDLVLERTEPSFPISSDELMATFSTHKVLYAGGSVDLTNEVISRLDAMDDIVP
ncbi:MAG: OmpH family outer membrane protein [Phycisphaerales bacterium]|nr:MAG: OmpH family outer membrane protein [Phycisphaerales bacterium]